MDELTLLRHTRDDNIEPPQDALNRGRAAFLERTGESTRPPVRTKASPRRGRKFAIGGLSTLGAAALATGLVLTNVVGLAGWRGGADPAAAAVLDDAAASAIVTVDPVLNPGQYLEMRTRSVRLTNSQSGDITASFQYGSEDTLYLPADTEEDWVWVRGPQKVVNTFGKDSETVAEEWWRDVSSSDSFETGDILRAPGGAFYGGNPAAGLGDLDALPRDPYRLLNYIYRVTLGTGPSPDTQALVYIADHLPIGAVPADLRAAMYQAAAMIPGVTFVDDQATLDGTTGVAIGRVENAWGTRFEIIIDPDTGAFIGNREVLLSDAAGVPAGTAFAWSTVTTNIVDHAPVGGTVCGKMSTDRDTGKC